MSFYDKYLRGVDMGKLWPSVVLPTVAAYNGFLAYGIKQIPAIGLAAAVFVSSLITFLVVPKTPKQLATEPRVVAETAKAIIAPVVAEAQIQVSDAVTATVQDATEQVQAIQQAAVVAVVASDTVSTALEPDEVVALKRLAAALRGDSHASVGRGDSHASVGRGQG